MYEEVIVQNGALMSKGVKEVQDNRVKTDNKSKVRKKIYDSVFDNQDSIADNAKMISLLMTLLSRMYDTYTATQKGKLSTEDKTLIEYTFTKFSTTNTRADVQFAKDGTTFIDKLLDRQAKVGSIVK